MSETRFLIWGHSRLAGCLKGSLTAAVLYNFSGTWTNVEKKDIRSISFFNWASPIPLKEEDNLLSLKQLMDKFPCPEKSLWDFTDTPD